MKTNLNIIIFNIYLHLLFSEDNSPTKIREPFIKNWKNTFEQSNVLSFKEETTKMWQKLQKVKNENSSIYFNSNTEQWCIDDYNSMEKLFLSVLLNNIWRDYNDNFYLEKYELTNELLSLVNYTFETSLESKDINLYELTE